MSFATDTLAKAQSAYQMALAGQTVQFGERRYSPHNIDELLKHVNYWQRQVDNEAASAAGQDVRGPLRFFL